VIALTLEDPGQSYSGLSAARNSFALKRRPYRTVTVTGVEGIPFATISRVVLPVSIVAGTSKLVETFCLPVATAIVL
jgi:hypothetical protein